MKVLIHVNEPDRWPVALNNITNMRKDAEGAVIETHVIANGRGVNGFVPGRPGADPDSIARMRSLSEAGVKFFACRNALEAQKIDPAELPDFVAVVSSSMVDIVKRQAEGFAYIKP